MDDNIQTEQAEQSEVVAPQLKDDLTAERIDRKDKNSSIRDSLKSKMGGTASEPAVGKSFVNGELEPSKEDSAQPKQLIVPPADWSPERKEKFKSWPIEAQQEISRRSHEMRQHFSKYTEELSHKSREYAELDSVVTADVRDDYKRQGTSVPQLVDRAISWDKALKANPREAAIEFLNTYGVNINDLVNGEMPEPEKPQYLTAEEARQLAHEEYEKKRQEDEENRVAAENYSALQSFISSKPIFQGDPSTSETLQTEVAKEITALKAMGYQGPTSALLEEAYKRAITLSDAFSSLRPQSPAAKPLSQTIEQTQKARAASKSISGGPGQGSLQQKATTTRENLRMRFYG